MRVLRSWIGRSGSSRKANQQRSALHGVMDAEGPVELVLGGRWVPPAVVLVVGWEPKTIREVLRLVAAEVENFGRLRAECLGMADLLGRAGDVQGAAVSRGRAEGFAGACDYLEVALVEGLGLREQYNQQLSRG